mgnify:FL=1
MSIPYCKFANEDNKYDKTLKMKNNTMIIACLCAVGIMNVSMLHVHENMQGTTRTRSYKVEEVVVTGTRNETDIRHLPMTISVVGRQFGTYLSTFRASCFDRTGSRAIHYGQGNHGIGL